jgi:Arm DNA-binding domain
MGGGFICWWNLTKLWRLKYRFAQKDRKLSLGAYPEVMLGLARERQLEARRLIDRDVDPLEQKKQEKRAARLASANSFESVGREWYLKFSASWAASHSSKVLLRLENNLYPWLGSRPISRDVTAHRSARRARNRAPLPGLLRADLSLRHCDRPCASQPGGGPAGLIATGPR